MQILALLMEPLFIKQDWQYPPFDGGLTFTVWHLR